MKNRFAAAATVLMLACAPASATTLDFSYLLATNNVASGSVEGSLAADGNRFVVTGINAFQVNGSSVTVPFSFGSADREYGIDPAGILTLSLDGSYLDFLLFSGSSPYFVLGVGDGVNAVAIASFGPQFAPGAVGSIEAFGGDGQFTPYVSANYSAQLAGSVPEPATWCMMILGLGAVGATLRQRSRVKVSFA